VTRDPAGSSDPDQPKAWFDVTRNRVMPPGTGTMHIILAVTDHGTPRLTRYRRVIVDIVPQVTNEEDHLVRHVVWGGNDRGNDRHGPVPHTRGHGSGCG